MSILVFPSRLKYRLFATPVDMRNGKRGLRRIVFRHLGKDLENEPILFLFYNKSHKTIRAVFCNGRLFLLLDCSQMDETAFTLPRFNPANKTLDIEPAKLMSLLNGLRIAESEKSDQGQPPNC